MTRRAVFMDRDGTVSAEVGYVTAVDQFRLLPRSAAAIRRLNEAGLLAIVVTNQSGLARGLFDEALMNEVHALLRCQLEQAGARLDGLYVCPHHPSLGEPPWRQECDCRKPKPGLLTVAAGEHDVALASSYVIGDSARDMEAARRAGAMPVLVLTGHGREDLRDRIEPLGAGARPAHVADDLLDAVEWILAKEGRS
ncbi:MAG: D-glycero-alpha-D-manno-heptose-1,7-bisphosphate 7-phosphatase [Candidatus Polarisedimenticolia bacterium]